MRLFATGLLVLLFHVNTKLHAQITDPGKTGIGFEVEQVHRDFGMGIHVTSPAFAGNKLAFRLRGHLRFLEHTEDASTTWTPYPAASVGMVIVSGTLQDFIRLYSEAGVTGLFPSDTFSTVSFEFGGYGLFGFEFPFEHNYSTFIEIGGMGTGARADHVELNPVYSNGLIIRAGFRIRL